MEFWTLIKNEDGSLFLFDGLEDDTSPPNKNEETTHNSEDDASPPKKRGKHVADFNSSEQKPFLDLGLLEHKPETQDQWKKLFQFNCYTSEPPKEVFQGMFTKCEDELKAVKKAYNKTAIFFKSEFEELEKLQPCSDSYTVIETINSRLLLVKKCILTADEMLPFFVPDVETYLKFRDGPLLELKRLEDEHYTKLEELAEMRDVDKLVEDLMCRVKSHDVEECSGLAMFHIYGIVSLLRKKSDCCYIVDRANMMDVEQFNRSVTKKVVIEYKDLIANINSTWEAFETTEANVKKDGWKLEIGITGHVNSLVKCLKTAGLMLRVLHQQLKLLRTKDVILNGYDDDFFDEWNEVSWHYELTSNFYM